MASIGLPLVSSGNHRVINTNHQLLSAAFLPSGTNSVPVNILTTRCWVSCRLPITLGIWCQGWHRPYHIGYRIISSQKFFSTTKYPRLTKVPFSKVQSFCFSVKAENYSENPCAILSHYYYWMNIVYLAHAHRTFFTLSAIAQISLKKLTIDWWYEI